MKTNCFQKRDHRHRNATQIWPLHKSTDKNCSCASFTIKASKFMRTKSQLFGSWFVGKGKNCCIKPDMCQFRRPIRVLTTWCDVLVVVVVVAAVTVLTTRCDILVLVVVVTAVAVLTTWCDVCGHNLPFSLPHSWLRRARQKEGDTWAARQDREALWHLTSRQAEP